MSHGKSDQEIISVTHNLSRFCLENRAIAWLALVVCLIWGWYGYHAMPQRKDPDIPVRKAKIITPWPGNSAEKVELLISKRIEEVVAQNSLIAKIDSVSRPGLSEITVEIDENRRDDPARVWGDLKIKLDKINNLPEGAGPINFNTDFGDTLALMLTVASPPMTPAEVKLRAQPLEEALKQARARAPGGSPRVALFYVYPPQQSSFLVRQGFDLLRSLGEARQVMKDIRLLEGSGFMGVDFATGASDEQILSFVREFLNDNVKVAEMHPDAWAPILVRDPAQTVQAMQAVAGDKYSYRDLDRFTDQIAERLRSVPSATKVDRSGVLEERIYLLYSQERLAAYQMSVAGLSGVLQARNISGASGMQETNQGDQVRINTAGEFTSERQIGDVLVSQSNGAGVYLRDLVNVVRSYESPPRYLTYLTYKDPEGRWRRARANLVTVQMRPGLNINQFGLEVDAALKEIQARLPADLLMVKTSDQPSQVEESVSLFNRCLEEAIVLVVIVSLIGFWEWRSAVLMALAIPITLAMTFALMHLMGLDIQQVSVASLIIALGLLVDDPVVAGDAIKHSLSAGHEPRTASWLGPTKLATAILYATITNIVAYLPLMLIAGDTGRFLYSLPLVIGASLVASRISSMTFIPLLGYYLLRRVDEPTPFELRRRPVYKQYFRLVSLCVDHRWKVLLSSFLLLFSGLLAASRLKTQFFPKDLQYLFYVNLFLPADKSLSATGEKARQVEQLILKTVPADKLESLTTFEGGGAPRFWSTLDPETPKLNFAMVVVNVNDKKVTPEVVDPIEAAIRDRITGVRADVRQLETGKPVGTPVAIKLSGDDIGPLLRAAEQVKELLRGIPSARQIRDNWGESLMTVDVQIDPDRANLAGVTNADIAQSFAAALNGQTVTYLREGDRRIPVVVKMRASERTRLEDLKNLYVYSQDGQKKVRLDQLARVQMTMQPQTIRREKFQRTIEVGCFPAPGVLPSEVFAQLSPRLKQLQAKLSGISIEVGGEQKEQAKGFANLLVVLLISVGMIYVALLSQFKNVVKPLVVFAAIPYGMVGAFWGLWLMGSPFGFMAFLGCASLVGVIVSHVIVLFDYIEEMHAHGENMRDALCNAGIARLRPVFITVGATVIALIPLAKSGGPLWQPLCYTQIGGLLLATLVTLVLVPVLYTIAVRDLKVLSWDEAHPEPVESRIEASAPPPADSAGRSSPETPASDKSSCPRAEP